MSPWRWQADVLELMLHVQPKASRDQFVGLHGEAIKLAISAPPVDGKANTHIVRLLADWFAVPKAQVSLVRGELSRQKCLRIQAPKTLPDALVALGLKWPSEGESHG